MIRWHCHGLAWTDVGGEKKKRCSPSRRDDAARQDDGTGKLRDVERNRFRGGILCPLRAVGFGSSRHCSIGAIFHSRARGWTPKDATVGRFRWQRDRSPPWTGIRSGRCSHDRRGNHAERKRVADRRLGRRTFWGARGDEPQDGAIPRGNNATDLTEIRAIQRAAWRISDGFARIEPDVISRALVRRRCRFMGSGHQGNVSRYGDEAAGGLTRTERSDGEIDRTAHFGACLGLRGRRVSGLI